MIPTVAKIVAVSEGLDLLAQHFSYGELALIEHRAAADPLCVGNAVALRPDPPVVQVAVGPAHGRLHDPIEFGQLECLGHEDAPPDQRLDVLQLDAQLVSGVSLYALELGAHAASVAESGRTLCQRCGKRSSMRLALCVGNRVTTSLR